MTSEQRDHIYSIQDKFIILSETKYRKGQEEHGGNLWEKSAYELLDAAIDEAIDQVIYLITLRSKM